MNTNLKLSGFRNLIALVLLLPSLLAQTPLLRDKPTPLRDLTGGEEHVYQLTLAAEEFVNLTVAYQRLLVSITLNDPNSKPMAEWSAGTDTVNQPEFAIIAPAAGQYQLILRAHSAATDVGPYQITVNAWRAATERDRQYAKARGLVLEGIALSNRAAAEARQQALGKYREALLLWRASGELRQELALFRLMSHTHYLMDEHHRALELAQEMLSKARTAGWRDLELKALTDIGEAQYSLNDYQAAQRTLELALTLSRTIPDRASELWALTTLSQASNFLGQIQAAFTYAQAALKIAREIADRNLEANNLNTLAVLSNATGEPDQAVAYYQQSLALLRQLGDWDAEAWVKLNLANVQLRRGELQQALDLNRQSQIHAHTTGRQATEGRAFGQLADIPFSWGITFLRRPISNSRSRSTAR